MSALDASWLLRRVRRGLAAFGVLALAGCAALVDPWERRQIPAEDRAHLTDPVSGYPGPLTPSQAIELQHAVEQIETTADLEAVRRWAEGFLVRHPAFAPATVVLAAIDLLEGRYREVVEALEPVVERWPGYVAAQLLLGRASVRLGDLPKAFAAYAAVADDEPLAASWAREILPRTREILLHRIEDSAARGRLEEAAASLARLREWAPDATETLYARALVARAAGDPSEELAAVRSLAERFPESRRWAQRRGEMEMLAGNPGVGVQILQELARRHPEDAELERQLRWAEFHWRLAMLPEEVRRLAAKPVLSRADFASLLFWLVPEVRAARSAEGRIATDILDHPRREEVARVVNLGLMDLDRVRHLFEPERPLLRSEALEVALRLVASAPSTHPCLGRVTPPPRRPSGPLCTAAAACGFIAEEAECLPEAAASGEEAVAMIRRTLHLRTTT